MKQVLIALLTTTINRYSLYVTRDLLRNNVIEDLTNILDYVTDIPEENQESITVVLSNAEVEALKRRMNELEETCVANNEVIDTQFKKIKELKDSNYIWQSTCNDLKEKNENLEEMIERARIVALRDDTIYDLKKEIVKAKEHELPYIDFQKIYDAAQEMEGK